MIDLRDAFHTLRLALSSQKYCGITPYYGSPTYHYLRMGMGMSVALLHDDIPGYDLPTIDFVQTSIDNDDDVSI